MTSAHILFIPAVITVGFVLGFIVGGRFTRDAIAEQSRRDDERKKARQAREERAKGRGPVSD